MTDRPIIFPAPMVRALLDGRKTQTRRLIRFPQWAAGCFTDPLRAGLPTREAAEDYPIRLADWARAWVEEEAPLPNRDGMPRRPWAILWVNGYAYVVDADGAKIATIYGSAKRKEHIAGAIYEAFGAVDAKEPA